MGRRRVLDTNRLIYFWRKKRKLPLDRYTEEDAGGWGRQLAEESGTFAIFSPVAVEFRCGVTTSRELVLARAFLGQFRVVDEGKFSSRD